MSSAVPFSLDSAHLQRIVRQLEMEDFAIQRPDLFAALIAGLTDEQLYKVLAGQDTFFGATTLARVRIRLADERNKRPAAVSTAELSTQTSQLDLAQMIQKRPDLFKALLRGLPEAQLHPALRERDAQFGAETTLAAWRYITANPGKFSAATTELVQAIRARLEKLAASLQEGSGSLGPQQSPVLEASEQNKDATHAASLRDTNPTEEQLRDLQERVTMTEIEASPVRLSQQLSEYQDTQPPAADL